MFWHVFETPLGEMEHMFASSGKPGEMPRPLVDPKRIYEASMCLRIGEDASSKGVAIFRIVVETAGGKEVLARGKTKLHLLAIETTIDAVFNHLMGSIGIEGGFRSTMAEFNQRVAEMEGETAEHPSPEVQNAEIIAKTLIATRNQFIQFPHQLLTDGDTNLQTFVLLSEHETQDTILEIDKKHPGILGPDTEIHRQYARHMMRVTE